MERIRQTAVWSTMVKRGVLFLLIWSLLTDGAVDSFWIGVPASLIALYVSMMLLPSFTLVWPALIKFIPFFLLHSLQGGWDVARRVFLPHMPIAPAFVDYPLRLPPGISQVIMTNTIGLLPGTLGVELEDNILKVHVLDAQKNIMTELYTVEQNVAQIFGIPLAEKSGKA
jgi:multicomponent Na+:H+ antiporter subunit E